MTGYQFSCALLVGGSVRCWGRVSDNDTPIIAGISGAVHIAAGRAHGCVLLDDGAVTCWGDSTFPHYELLTDDLLLLAAGAFTNCSVHRNGRLECWGGASCSLRLVPNELGMVVDVDTGGFQACAIDSEGWLMCWGDLDPAMMTPADIAP